MITTGKIASYLLAFIHSPHTGAPNNAPPAPQSERHRWQLGAEADLQLHADRGCRASQEPPSGHRTGGRAGVSETAEQAAPGSALRAANRTQHKPRASTGKESKTSLTLCDFELLL